ncbi:hypothetical protein HanHA300_Chr13g0486691 [Helianthus annuus]|nr:hypothetical protein HanHA300_Chr13g0486691 [Helianthus annuus]KAJ0664120.1 hypothetical protein HanLR1_Chr13g0488681 [Helianthus annuus]KAJ0671600.1 hypothetical protein HanOQP8_Chr13g0487361 [Helianthus annuus]
MSSVRAGFLLYIAHIRKLLDTSVVMQSVAPAASRGHPTSIQYIVVGVYYAFAAQGDKSWYPTLFRPPPEYIYFF